MRHVLFKPITPKKGQEEYAKALSNKDVVLVSGPAGTGKTLLALNAALTEVLDPSSKIKKICIVRPYIFSSNERLGSVPGTVDEKIAPFVLAIKDNLRELITDESQINKFIEKYFEFACVSTLRGRSFNNTFILVEEAQNLNINDDPVLLIMSRLGHHSRLVISGDQNQTDLNPKHSAFTEAINIFQDCPEVASIELKTIHRNILINKFLMYFAEFRKHNSDI